jgi:hypothetical protein
MYCPACGNFITSGLNFCNSCGAKVKQGNTPARKSGNPIAFLAAALTVIDIAALFFMALIMLLFLERNVEGRVIAIFSAFFFLMLGFTNFAFIRMISKLVGVHIESSREENTEQRPVRSFEPAAPAVGQLEAQRQPVTPVGSVTDHTTRTLDEVLLKER